MSVGCVGNEESHEVTHEWVGVVVAVTTESRETERDHAAED